MLWYIYIILLTINVLSAIFRWKHLPGTLKIISVLVSSALIIEVCRYHSKDAEKNLLTHQSIIAEFILIAVYYAFLLPQKKRIFIYTGITFYVIAVIFSCLSAPNFFLEAHFSDSLYLAICTSVWAILFFLELLKRPVHYSLKSDGNFWINCSNLLFYPGTLLLFGLGNYLKQVSPELAKKVNPINNILNLTLYILYLVAFCVSVKEKPRAIKIDS